jgi:hypothetical protein
VAVHDLWRPACTGEASLKRLINWILAYFSNLDIPVKRGTFVEFRQGMLNVSPIGRNCSRAERNDFEKFDMENKVSRGRRLGRLNGRTGSCRRASIPAAFTHAYCPTRSSVGTLRSRLGF